jgi:DNA-binding CsgD family transcriptional regulator
LVGRDQEFRALDGLLDALRGGESRAMAIRGEPGVGKTALLDHLSARATDCRVVAVVGAEAEMELAFAALHQLCAPMLDRLTLLPAPQRQALEVTFGISMGPAPERLVVGLAVLSLLSEVAAEQPLLCLVDDAQWLDRASAQILTLVGRRLGKESVGIVISSREPGTDLAGIPELVLEGLAEEDARTLLVSGITGPVDERVLDQLLAETRGNPLALLELPRDLTAGQAAGGFAPPGTETLAGSIEQSFRRRVEVLPIETQRLLLLAAADPLGDPLVLWRAAETLGIDPAAGGPAVADDLVSFGARVRFRHPLVRSAVYRSASPEAKREAHAALADATDGAIDPERRAWHRAQAAAGPDEEVAAELERYAERARARGGLAAAAAFLERATWLSPDRAKRAVRALAASQAKVQAGAHPSVLDLIAIADAGPLEEADRARLDLVRAQLAFATKRGRDAPPLLLKAAKRLEAIDVGLARATYLDAFMAASQASRFAGPEADVAAVARAAGSAPPPQPAAGSADLLLDGLAATFNEGYAAGVPILRSALAAAMAGVPTERELRCLTLAFRAAMHVWDFDRALSLSARSVLLAREVGALNELSLSINDHAILLLLSGQLSAATAAVEEAYAIADAQGNDFVPYGAMGVAAWRGNKAEASILIEASIKNATLRGEGGSLAGAEWAQAVLSNGLGDYQVAYESARRSVGPPNQLVLGLSNWSLVELIEAGARTGMHASAAEASQQVSDMAAEAGTDWALGVEARSRALLSDDDNDGKLFRESMDRLGASPVKGELARTHLLFGEWLRRERRTTEARKELHTALEMLEAMGMEGFAERARRELRASGETARKRRVEMQGELTPQEAQVAKLAREGMSNPEIAARMYISARTVQYHLSKVFTKLGITSRSQLDRVIG